MAPGHVPVHDIRRRYWVLFAAVVAVALAVFAAIGWLIGDLVPASRERAALLLAFWSAVLLVFLVSGLAWWLLYRAAFREVFRFAHELWLVAHGDAATQVSLPRSPLLAPLADAARLLAERLAQMRREFDEAAAASAIRVEGEKVRLEAILRDLSEAVVVCDLESRVLLYNSAALRLLQVSGEVGLGRSLFNVMSREPVLHTLDMLRERLATGGGREDLQADFVGSSVSGDLFLRAHMRLIIEPDGGCRSYVLALTDATQELEEVSSRDRLLTANTEGLRAPVANILAAAETLASHPEMAPGQRRRFDEVILKEVHALQARLEEAIAQHRTLATGGWLLFDIYSADLVGHVARALKQDGLELTPVGTPAWLRGDSLSLAEALAHLVRQVCRETGTTHCDVGARTEGRQVYLDLIWTGRPVAPALIESWLHARLARVPGAVTLRDVVARHDSELWSEALGDGRARLRFPMVSPQRPQGVIREPRPPRPVFYDFDLLQSLQAVGPIGGQALRALSYVVFDTETTGLRPHEGDEIVAIAGVRVVNGRVLSDERFERVVDPRIPIPASSTAFHGITDDMVRNKPPIEVVLRQFHAFCGDSTLVAHNAAFDMKFIRLKQGTAGVAFDRPVLDTLLLAAAIGEGWLDPSLDGLAQRLGVDLRGRHTALGDTLATAEVFVRMIPLLEAAGIVTLDQALDACRRHFQRHVEPTRTAF
ncbi:exonuclease [Sulfurifustis variabilis]|uniref:DNA-directed DNA polymerase n=1 Tax=Sulfurifustis variabilis TaxID=1675686 RepID=A0A1B4V7B0_9GAMM|nr:exonuclease domain-containing protein [Sulfurifustis variabilis]BAU47214.1 exonuclease [Sulfurifustis variabilis]